jgi:hypothetical protein
MRLIKEAQLGNNHATGSEPAGDEHGTKAGFRDRTRAATASTRAPGISPNRLCASKSAAACKTSLSTSVPRKTGHPFATARWPANTGRQGLREEGMAWVRLLTRGSSGVKPRQGDVGVVAAWRGAGRGGGMSRPGCWCRTPVQLPGCHLWRQGMEQQRRCALPIGRAWSRAGGSACSPSSPASPWRWAHALQCAGRHPPVAPHPPGLPFLLLCCRGGRKLGEKSPGGGGGQGQSKGRLGNLYKRTRVGRVL